MIPGNSLFRKVTTGCLLLSLHGLASAVVQIESVAIGNAGNPASQFDPTYGSVGYEYRIATYETSIADYCEFLNATAASDPYGLYNPAMGTNLNVVGISRSGSSGTYSYSVIGDGNRPITYVSWFDAARFANWMHNGQGSGSTETGVYTLNGSITNPALKGPGATVWIPTRNEWIKAAYYDPATQTYSTFATGSHNGSYPGNDVGSAAHQANWLDNDFTTTPGNGFYSASQNYLTPGGAFSGSASFYGTFDQTGNVSELMDIDAVDALFVAKWGGEWGLSSSLFLLGEVGDFTGLNTEDSTTGFRLAFVIPEPSHAMLGASGVGLLALRRRRDWV